MNSARWARRSIGRRYRACVASTSAPMRPSIASPNLIRHRFGQAFSRMLWTSFRTVLGLMLRDRLCGDQSHRGRAGDAGVTVDEQMRRPDRPARKSRPNTRMRSTCSGCGTRRLGVSPMMSWMRKSSFSCSPNAPKVSGSERRSTMDRTWLAPVLQGTSNSLFSQTVTPKKGTTRLVRSCYSFSWRLLCGRAADLCANA